MIISGHICFIFKPIWGIPTDYSSAGTASPHPRSSTKVTIRKKAVNRVDFEVFFEPRTWNPEKSTISHRIIYWLVFFWNFPYIGNFMIPTDELHVIFQRGQPPTSLNWWYPSLGGISTWWPYGWWPCDHLSYFDVFVIFSGWSWWWNSNLCCFLFLLVKSPLGTSTRHAAVLLAWPRSLRSFGGCGEDLLHPGPWGTMGFYKGYRMGPPRYRSVDISVAQLWFMVDITIDHYS